MSLRLLAAACSTFLISAWAQGPQVKVMSATSKQVQLAWTASSGASSYSVYRTSTKVTSSGIPGDPLKISTPPRGTPIATVSGLSYTDNIPDPNATYTYCVAPVSSNCNNSATVGPPPFGFNVVVPSTVDTEYSAGIFERMALDANGDPAMAYYVDDPNGDGDDSDDTVYFVSWNRASYAWNPPVLVGVSGHGYSEGPVVPLSLAHDDANGMWGIAYHQNYPEADGIVLATSTDGVNWKGQNITGDPCFNGCYDSPSLAMWNGTFHVAVMADLEIDAFPEGSGVLYLSGKVTDPPSKWSTTPAPFPAGYTSPYYTVSLALDSDHNPGIAYMVCDEPQVFEGIAFWRPGQTSAMLAGRNDGYTTNDNPDLSLAFAGTQPRIAIAAAWNYGSYDPDQEPADLYAMQAATPSGALWMPPVDVPPDNVNVLELPWITVGSKGQTAIVMASNHDPEGAGMTCGFPKIARSTDFRAFQTCAPAPVDAPSFYPNNMTPVARFGTDDKLWVVFNNNDDGGDIGIGLVLWREP
jgi:hypothetical protein